MDCSTQATVLVFPAVVAVRTETLSLRFGSDWTGTLVLGETFEATGEEVAGRIR